MVGTATSSATSGELHISGRSRGITEFDLGSVFATDEERAALTMVRSLDLAHNRLKEVRALQPLVALASLDLSHNLISSLSGLPLGLTRLHLAHNSLTSLDGIAALPNLRELDVSHNKLVTLAGLSVASPIVVLHAAHNRLARVPHLDALSRLRVLDLSHNFLAGADALAFLESLVELQSAAFRGCPVADLNEYRAVVRSLAPSVTTLDGAPLITAASNDNEMAAASAAQRPRGHTAVAHYDSAAVPPTSIAKAASTAERRSAPFASSLVARTLGGREGATGAAGGGNSQAPSSSASLADAATPLSASVLHGRVDDRRHELAARSSQLERQLNDALAEVAQTRRDNEALSKANAALQKQLSELRRVMSDELEEVAREREARAAREAELAACKTRLAKAARDAKYATERSRSVQEAHAEQLERRAVLLEHENRQLVKELTALRRATAPAAASAPRGHREVLVTMAPTGEGTHDTPARAAPNSSSGLNAATPAAAAASVGAAAVDTTNISAIDTTADTSAATADNDNDDTVEDAEDAGPLNGARAAQLAAELKRWVLKEIGVADAAVHPANGAGTSPAHPPTLVVHSQSRGPSPSANASPPLPSAHRGVRELWERNERLLAETRRSRTMQSSKSPQGPR